MQECSYRFYATKAKMEKISTFPRLYPNGSALTVIAEKLNGDCSDKSRGSKQYYTVTVNGAGNESSFALITDFTALHSLPTETELADLEWVGDASPIGLAIPPYCFLEL
ncbi:TPA: hypothetical protein MD210_004514 [Klebsiella pneumoniae]|nr:hypothetical protein [Klebsiella pneumoniae]HBV2978073.1 hypothetical protein [Klebsiella pneumoniae]HBV5904172.1 hypothetical protein [Klebsiella pneumoniae]HBX7724714.1 hypothetical protein [Klebsiella pneumoniae]HDZ1162952.1 hypothetical protein [Klebsiella pneumoniae]